MIICSAVRTANGKIYRGHRHGDCIRSAIDHGEPAPITQAMQGFMDSNGLFLPRAEAAKIAYACGQISEPAETLLSEDLW